MIHNDSGFQRSLPHSIGVRSNKKHKQPGARKTTDLPILSYFYTHYLCSHYMLHVQNL
jgi:hypothetical protein